MPGGDGTGPRGMGPMTGRAAGFCAGYPSAGFANAGPRMGLGLGRGRYPYGNMQQGQNPYAGQFPYGGQNPYGGYYSAPYPYPNTMPVRPYYGMGFFGGRGGGRGGGRFR